MEYSQCSPSQQLQQPHQKQQQQERLSRDDSGSIAEMDDGWFSKCRCEGSSCMVAHCSASITSQCMHSSHHQWRMPSGDIFDTHSQQALQAGHTDLLAACLAITAGAAAA